MLLGKEVVEVTTFEVLVSVKLDTVVACATSAATVAELVVVYTGVKLGMDTQ